MRKKWGQFCLGIAMIYTFTVWLLPLMTQQEHTQKVLKYIEEKDIDTNALFYTESDEAREAEYLLRKKRLKR